MPFGVADTSVYSENFRTGRFTLPLMRSRFVFRCSSVVLRELRRGAKSRLELKFVRDLWRRSKVLAPTETEWLKAGELLNLIRRRERFDLQRTRELAFDLLNALSARRIGATVVTRDRADFETIGRFCPFNALYWD